MGAPVQMCVWKPHRKPQAAPANKESPMAPLIEQFLDVALASGIGLALAAVVVHQLSK